MGVDSREREIKGERERRRRKLVDYRLKVASGSSAVYYYTLQVCVCVWGDYPLSRHGTLTLSEPTERYLDTSRADREILRGVELRAQCAHNQTMLLHILRLDLFGYYNSCLFKVQLSFLVGGGGISLKSVFMLFAIPNLSLIYFIISEIFNTSALNRFWLQDRLLN